MKTKTSQDDRKGEIIPSTPSKESDGSLTKESLKKITYGEFYKKIMNGELSEQECYKYLDLIKDLAISKTHSAYIKEAGFKDADEEIAKLQAEHQKFIGKLNRDWMKKLEFELETARHLALKEVREWMCKDKDTPQVVITQFDKHFGVDDVKKKVNP